MPEKPNTDRQGKRERNLYRPSIDAGQVSQYFLISRLSAPRTHTAFHTILSHSQRYPKTVQVSPLASSYLAVFAPLEVERVDPTLRLFTLRLLTDKVLELLQHPDDQTDQ